MKYTIQEEAYKYLEGNLAEATEGHEMNEDGTFTVEGTGKWDNQPLTFLYFWNLTMNGEPGQTYQDEFDQMHSQFEINPEEACSIPGCVELIEFHDGNNILDMWEDDNGFMHYTFNKEMKTDYEDPEGTRKVRITLTVEIDIKNSVEIDLENFDFDEIGMVVLKDDSKFAVDYMEVSTDSAEDVTHG